MIVTNEMYSGKVKNTVVKYVGLSERKNKKEEKNILKFIKRLQCMKSGMMEA